MLNKFFLNIPIKRQTLPLTSLSGRAGYKKGRFALLHRVFSSSFLSLILSQVSYKKSGGGTRFTLESRSVLRLTTSNCMKSLLLNQCPFRGKVETGVPNIVCVMKKDYVNFAI